MQVTVNRTFVSGTAVYRRPSLATTYRTFETGPTDRVVLEPLRYAETSCLHAYQPVTGCMRRSAAHLGRLANFTRLPETVSHGELLAQPQQLQHVRQVKQQATEVRAGQVIDLKGKLMQIQKYQHTQGSGRQLGNVQLELRDLKAGSKHQQRCRSYDTLEVVRLDDRNYKFLYAEGSQLHFMDPETYEQEAVDQLLFGGLHDYLVEDMQASLSSHEGQVVAGNLPQHVTLNVTTDPVAKGDEKSPQYKPAVVGAGRKIMVPPFISTGERIVVDTRDHTFVRRAK